MQIPRHLFPIFTAAAFVAAIAAAIVLQSQAMSALLALSCVVVPQQIALFAARRADGEFSFGAMFGIWGMKFSLTLLFLVLALKTLAAAEALSTVFFIVGVVGGVVLNILTAARMARTADVPPQADAPPQVAKAEE